MTREWLIYGANGYTGRLVAQLAVARGQQPVLAGRDRAQVATLARELGLEYRAVALADAAGLRETLSDVAVVAHCAGPFAITSAPMVAACLATGTHYLDVTGEPEVFEQVYAAHQAAVDAGVVLLPGGGFDVVPTDCLAGLVAATLPGATSLELAFRSGGGLSRGTARTGVRGLAAGAQRRVGGVLRPTPLGEPSRLVPFPSGTRRVGAIRWGDVVSAYRSTGIPDITVYSRVPDGRRQRWRRAAEQRLLRLAVAQRLADRAARRRPAGPSAEVRAATGVQVWAEVRDGDGETRSGTLVGPNGYDLTADAVVRAVGYLADGHGPAGPIAPGAHTPATALGAGFVHELTGVTVAV